MWGRNKGSVPARFPVRELASGEGPGAEEQEVDGSYLWVALEGVRAARGGVATEGGDGGGSMPRRWLANSVWMGQPGLGASVGGEEGGCGLDLG